MGKARTVGDPVCGVAVSSESTFRATQGGLVYCFCSDTCRDRFLQDPVPYAMAVISRGLARADEAETVPPAPSELGGSLAPLTRGGFPDGSRPFSPPSGAAPARGVTQSAFQEKHFAQRVATDLLELHHREARRDASMHGMELYRRLVMLRMGVDAFTADLLLEQARESFASWPTERPLRFHDVVHMVVIREFKEAHPGVAWFGTNVGQIVAKLVDPRL